MSKGGIHGKAVMVGKGMAVDTFQCAVTAVAQTLDYVLIRDAGSMQGTGHVMTVVMQTGMREAVPLQKSGMA